MDYSTSPISASSAGSFIPPGIASNIHTSQGAVPDLPNSPLPIDDTVETQDQDANGTADWKRPIYEEETRSREPSTGDFLDLTG